MAIFPMIFLMPDNKVSNFDKYLKSDNCYIENIIEGKEYFIYKHGHELKAQGKDKIEYKCTDGNTYIR